MLPVSPSTISFTCLPGGLNFCAIPFWLFTLFMGFSWQKYWCGLSFPSPVNHILSEHFTLTRPSGVVRQGMAHSFIELIKPLHHDKTGIHEEVYLNRNQINESTFIYHLIIPILLSWQYNSFYYKCCKLNSKYIILYVSIP